MQTIEEILSQGENVEIEFKSSSDSLSKDIWSTYSAMANTNGGVILLGVAENDNEIKVKGVTDATKILKDFWSTVNSDKVNKNILVDEDVELLEIDDKKIIKINIPRANYLDKPIFVGENPYHGTYKRLNDGDFRCSQEEVNRLIRDASTDGVDSRIIEHYGIDELDIETLTKYRTHFENKHRNHPYLPLNDQDFLRSLGCIAKDPNTGKMTLTQAGLLLFGKGLSIREVFPGLKLDYLDKRNLIGDQRWSDRLTIDFTWENNLYNFYTRVLPKIVSDLKRPFKMDYETLERIDDTPVHAAVREAFANAVIHCDYNIPGTLRADREDDKFIFMNPGILKLSLDQIFNGGMSETRNPIIQQCFRMVGFGESIGSGIALISNAWEEQGWVAPKMEENHTLGNVRLTLLMKSEDECSESVPKCSKNVLKCSENVLKNVSIMTEVEQRESEILALLKENPHISRTAIMKKLKLSQRKVQWALDGLTEKNVIKRFGGARGGYWEILG